MRSLSIFFAATLFVFPVASLRAQTEIVGTLPGDFSVDNKGTANYTIPLAVPPGINGMQPSLAISYNSGAGNSIMGVGFNLSAGQSAITRGRRLLARDGDPQGVQFTDKDRLYLDGKLLVRVSGDYLESGSEYRTEVESFTKITSHGVANSEPDYFKVVSKNGTIFYYGKGFPGAQSSDDLAFQLDKDGLALVYALAQVEDSFGNYMDYHYTSRLNSGGAIDEYTLDRIEYGGSKVPANAHFEVVNFVYNENPVVGDLDTSDPEKNLRDDVQVGWIAGVAKSLRQRLDKIEVLFEGNVVSEYDFTYEYSPVSHRSRLISIGSKLDPSETSALAPLPDISLEWSDVEGGFQTPKFSPSGIGGDPLPGVYFGGDMDAFGDFNGDGKSDFVYVINESIGYLSEQYTGIRVCLSNGVSFEAPDTWMSSGSVTGMDFLKTGDFNGDGRTDLVWANYPDMDEIYAVISTEDDQGDGRFVGLDGQSAPTLLPIDGHDFFRDYYPNGSTTDSLYSALAAGRGIKSRLTIADFDTDGRDDLLFHSFQGILYVSKSDGDGFDSPEVWRDDVNSIDSQGYFLTLAPIDEWRWIHWVNNYFSISPIPSDYTGDGIVDYAWIEHKHDFRYPSPGDNIYQAKSEYRLRILPTKVGGGFEPPIASPTIFQETQGDPPLLDESIYKVLPGDYNGDGATDLLVLRASGSGRSLQWRMLQFRGAELIEGMGVGVEYDELVDPLPLTFEVSDDNFIDSYALPTTEAYWSAIIEDNDYAWMWRDEDPENGLSTYSAVANAAPENMYAIDLNRDGKTDYAWLYLEASDDEGVDGDGVYEEDVVTENEGFWVCYSDGEGGFRDPVKILDFDAGDLANMVNFPYAVRSTLEYGYIYSEPKRFDLKTIDIDGNGNLDWIVCPAWSNERVYALGHKDPGDLLLGISDGLGSRIEIEYKALTDESVYTKGMIDDPVTPTEIEGTTYPIREVQDSRYVVSDIYKDVGGDFWTDTNSDDIRDWDEVREDVYHVSYQYSGNRTDLSGRGSLGFHSFVTLDHQTGLFKYQFLEQSFPMTGLTKREQTYRALNWDKLDPHDFDLRIVSWKDNSVIADLVVDDLDQAYGTIFPMITASLEHRWEDGTTAHYNYTASNPTGNQFSDVEDLFIQGLPSTQEPYSTIRAQTWFDDQADSDEDNTELPAAFETNTFGQ